MTSPTADSLHRQPAAGDTPPRPRGRVVLAWLTAVLVLLVGVFYLGGGWYFSEEIRDGITVRKPTFDPDLRVIEVTRRGITLEPTEDAPAALDSDKVYGLQWDDGFGQVGALLRFSRDRITRSFTVLQGSPPDVGDGARLKREAFPDAETALGVPVREVTIQSDGQALPAWLAPGRGTTWAILVHGKGVTRSETLRLMRATTALGLTSLDIAYRRDPEMGGGLIRFGQDEWPDLEAAVEYAVDHGARRVVLLGCSSGAGIIASFLESSRLAPKASAVVLDAPMLDFGATVAHGAADRELPVLGLPVPDSLVWVAHRIAGFRFDLDPGRTDYLDDTDWLDVPALVFHGTADDTVPTSVTERLDAAKPELVEYVLVERAEHVESWNTMPLAYDDHVQDFLAAYAPEPGAPGPAGPLGRTVPSALP